jgi:hypothetical protein
MYRKTRRLIWSQRHCMSQRSCGAHWTRVLQFIV